MLRSASLKKIVNLVKGDEKIHKVYGVNREWMNNRQQKTHSNEWAIWYLKTIKYEYLTFYLLANYYQFESFF